MKQKTKNSLSKVHVSFTIGVKINKQNPKRQTPPIKKKNQKQTKEPKTKQKTPHKKPQNPQIPKQSLPQKEAEIIQESHQSVTTTSTLLQEIQKSCSLSYGLPKKRYCYLIQGLNGCPSDPDVLFSPSHNAIS